MDIRQIVGDNVRCLRHKLKWSQEKLSEKSGLSADYIGRLERGLDNISVENLVKLSIALDIEPPSFLIEGYCRNNNDNNKNSNNEKHSKK